MPATVPSFLKHRLYKGGVERPWDCAPPDFKGTICIVLINTFLLNFSAKVLYGSLVQSKESDTLEGYWHLNARDVLAR